MDYFVIVARGFIKDIFDIRYPYSYIQANSLAFNGSHIHLPTNNLFPLWLSSSDMLHAEEEWNNNSDDLMISPKPIDLIVDKLILRILYENLLSLSPEGRIAKRVFLIPI